MKNISKRLVAVFCMKGRISFIIMTALIFSVLFAASAYSEDGIGDEFSCGLVCFKANNKWGYIDTTGTVVIPPQWDYVSNFYGGYATVFNGSMKKTLGVIYVQILVHMD